uniref:L-seryl-tRNA(Sec) kinase-like n=1 Tax=Ciona intestinalis TaxID=7719 RepID=UPI000180B53E|nr:L-seryl-tRNA(Sec) kinase-like [Ciona intestinalis]|eukprot:XP_002120985.1 L-seryl-tRNA(Sec) kinase-like [Ciona intestinalis]
MVAVCICVLSGLPASGKTTISTEITQRLTCIQICYDALIQWLDLTGEGKWKLARNQVVSLVEKMLEMIKNVTDVDHVFPLSGNGYNLLNTESVFEVWDILVQYKRKGLDSLVFFIDDTMQYRSMRYDYVQLAKKYQTGFCVIQTSCPLDICIKRNESRPKRQSVSRLSVVQIHAQLETIGRCAWEKECSILIETFGVINENTYKSLVQLIKNNLSNPLCENASPDPVEVKNSRLANHKSVLHQADLIMRVLVGDMIKRIRTENLKVRNTQVLNAKKQILKDLKQDMDFEEFISSETKTVDVVCLKGKLEKLFNVFLNLDTN